MRRRIQKGLNKGEAANALARASALTILIDAIAIWNTVYLTKAVDYLRERNELNDELLAYVSPLNWEHINLYGHYSFDKKRVTTLDNLRPLNIKTDE